MPNFYPSKLIPEDINQNGKKNCQELLFDKDMLWKQMSMNEVIHFDTSLE